MWLLRPTFVPPPEPNSLSFLETLGVTIGAVVGLPIPSCCYFEQDETEGRLPKEQKRKKRVLTLGDRDDEFARSIHDLLPK